MFVHRYDFERMKEFINTENSTQNQCALNYKACFVEKFSTRDKYFRRPNWGNQHGIFYVVEGYDQEGNEFIQEGEWPGEDSKHFNYAENKYVERSYLYRITSKNYAILSWMKRKGENWYDDYYGNQKQTMEKDGITFEISEGSKYCSKKVYKDDNKEAHKYDGNDMSVPFPES